MRFDISDYQKLSPELMVIVEVHVERSVTGVKMFKFQVSWVFVASGHLRRVLEVFFYVFGAQLRKANDDKSVVRSTLLLFFSSGCSAFASRSAFCFCLLRFEDVYFLLHSVAQLYAVMFIYVVIFMIRQACDVFMFLWVQCLALEGQRDRLSP